MPLHSSLPPASEVALAHSHALQSLIRKRIAAADGWITFEEFMNLALYAPGLGYYASGATKLGDAGDFVTAPEMSPLFGQTLARQIIQIMQHLDRTDILEFGAGTGKLAADILLELEQHRALPEHYFILEVSAELRQRQQNWLQERASHLFSRVAWLEQPPVDFSGIMLGNEVLDAMPVHIVSWRGDQILQRGVTWQDDRFAWLERPLEHAELRTLANALTTHINPDQQPDWVYSSEINLAARYFIHSLADSLRQGVILLLDYGFGRSEFYHPQRQQGTLMCHYRHHAHDDPFFLPGLQDITSHVDFSALLEVADQSGLSLTGYTTQAHFLINCGITTVLGRTASTDTRHYLPQVQAMQKLISPAEMGELFKAIAFAKNFPEPLLGFSRGDLSRLL